MHTKAKSNHAFMYRSIASKNQHIHAHAPKKHHSIHSHHLKQNNDVLRIKDCKRHNSRNTCAFQGFCNYCHAYGHKAYFYNSRKRAYHASSHRHGANMSYKRYCFYCGDFDHISYNCALKCKGPKTKLIWVPKGTCTNLEGPKYVGYQKCQIDLFCRKMNLPIKQGFK